MANPSICHVFCLNRKLDSSSYQVEKNKSLGLSTPLDPARVTLVNLVDLVATASLAPHLLLLSSFSSVKSIRGDSMRIPEQVIYDEPTASPNGYAESKYLAEQLLDYATQKLAIITSIARIGQVAGAVQHRGVWTKTEWFPSLIRAPCT